MRPAARPPIATLLLIVVCIGAAFMVLIEPEMVDQVGFRSEAPSLFSALACIFLHQNLFHLLGNMVFLAAVGPAVEMGAGTIRFLAVFLGGGLVGVAAHWQLASRASDAPLVGASGAIAACAAYYSIRYMRLRVPIVPGVGVPVIAIAGIWLAFQVIGSFGGPVAVSYWAHLGGFAFGLLASLLFGAPKLVDQEIGHAALDRLNLRSPAARLAAAQHQLEAHPSDVRAMRERAAAYADLGDHEDEITSLLSLLDVLPESEQATVLARLGALRGLAKLPSLRCALLADRYKDSDANLCRSLLESVAAQAPNDAQRPDALLALAALERESAPTRAAVWLKELFDTYPMHPATELARKRGWTP